MSGLLFSLFTFRGDCLLGLRTCHPLECVERSRNTALGYLENRALNLGIMGMIAFLRTRDHDKIGNMFARPRWSMYMWMYLTDSVRRIGAAIPCVSDFCFYCSRALSFVSGIIYSAAEFEPGSVALVFLHHRRGFKLVSDCNTNYLSGICLGLTLQVKFRSRVNWFIGKYTRRTVLPHRWILFASQSRHLVMGLKNRMSLTQALGLLRCRLQAIPGERYRILSNTVYENNRYQIFFQCKNFRMLVVVLRFNRGSDSALDISKELNTSGVYRNQSRDFYMQTQRRPREQL